MTRKELLNKMIEYDDAYCSYSCKFLKIIEMVIEPNYWSCNLKGEEYIPLKELSTKHSLRLKRCQTCIDLFKDS